MGTANGQIASTGAGRQAADWQVQDQQGMLSGGDQGVRLLIGRGEEEGVVSLFPPSPRHGKGRSMQFS